MNTLNVGTSLALGLITFTLYSIGGFDTLFWFAIVAFALWSLSTLTLRND